jgi:hypothetical protein
MQKSDFSLIDKIKAGFSKPTPEPEGLQSVLYIRGKFQAIHQNVTDTINQRVALIGLRNTLIRRLEGIDQSLLKERDRAIVDSLKRDRDFIERSLDKNKDEITTFSLEMNKKLEACKIENQTLMIIAEKEKLILTNEVVREIFKEALIIAEDNMVMMKRSYKLSISFK